MIAVLATLAFFSTAAQEVTLPAFGETWTAYVFEEYQDPQTGEVEQSFTYRVEKKVIKRIRGGYVIEAKRTMTENKIGDTQVPLPKNQKPLIEEYLVDDYGLRTKVAEGNRQQEEQRIAQLTDILCPERTYKNNSVAYRRTVEGSDTKKETRLEYSNGQRSSRDSGYQCDVAISDTGWPKPIEATGNATFSEKSAIPSMLNLTAKNVPLPGGNGSLFTVQIKMYSIEVK